MIDQPYVVKYRAKNIFGWSDYSDLFTIETIMVPDQALPVSTELIGTNVVFSWAKPDERGDSIFSYNVYIASQPALTSSPSQLFRVASSDSFILSSQYCNQITQRSCSIPMATLSNPLGDYKLTLGTLIRAKVTATNSMGESIASAPNI